MRLDYSELLERKTPKAAAQGFRCTFMPDMAFDFQRILVEWAVEKGRGAIFADCGMGKTLIELAWAENVVRHTNGRVLILTPLAVGEQTVAEAAKFGIEAKRCRDGKPSNGINVTNYERLHLFDPSDFAGVVCDESSILKNYAGATKDAVVAFMRTIPYRLLLSATPSPNDYTELGNSVEALGIMRRVEMLASYFVHDGGDTGKWRLKGHAFDPFWAFVASWARAVRRPSDIGCLDDRFVLPALRMHDHVLPSAPPDGTLFPVEAVTLDEQRAERRQSLDARCGMVADIANDTRDPFLAWCSLNRESEALASMIVDAKEITGSQTDEEKEELMVAFARGQLRSLVTKPSIAGFGLNWQHCGRMSFFPSHSHEQYYQSLRRCWRFGRTLPVDVHIVTTEAEAMVMENMRRKEKNADDMFDKIVQNMRVHYTQRKTRYTPTKPMEVPSWL